MEQRVFFAVLSAALLAAAALGAQTDDHRDRRPSSAYSGSAPGTDQAVPSDDASHKAKGRAKFERRRAQERERAQEDRRLPNRVSPWRALPGQLPERSQPGASDGQRGLIRNHLSTPAPPEPSQGQTKSENGLYK